jgi:CheY-like chemotaxis protein
MFSKKVPPVDSVKEHVARYLRAADLLSKEGKYEDALMQIERALKLDPKNYYARSFFERIRTHIHKEEKASSDKAEVKAVSDDQKIEQISLLLRAADQFIGLKNYKLALQQVAKVYAIDSQNYYAQTYSDRIDQLMTQEQGASGRRISPEPASPLPAPAAAPALPVEPLKIGERASLTLYRQLLKEMWFDGKITDTEGQELKKVRGMFKISDEEHLEIEKQIQIDAYVEALRIAWRDGVITQNESDVLQMMRQKFNISMEQHMSAEAKILWAKNTPGAKPSILLADDEETLLLSLAVKLRKHGYEVITAESVEQALEKLQQTIPSIIVSDLLFGEGIMSGIEFYQRVRDDARLKNVPFLLMSGISDEFVVRAGMRMGVDTFIQKPFDLELLLATIEGKLKS